MRSTDPRVALEALAERDGVSLAALSRMLRRNDAYLQQYVRRGTPRDLAERDRSMLADFFRVDQALLGGPPSTPLLPRVRRLDLAASAGPGTLTDDDPAGAGLAFDPRLLASLGVDPANAAVLRAAGESMLPTIGDGDTILVDESDRRVARKPGIFVARLDGVLVVKRIARSGDRLVFTSDNPDFPAIAPQSPDAVTIIGRVVWLSRSLR